MPSFLHGQQTAPHLRWVDLEQMLAAAMLTCAPPGKSARIDLEVAGGCGLFTDPLPLHRVLDSLLRHALATVPQPMRVAVSARPRGHDAVVIRVSGPTARITSFVRNGQTSALPGEEHDRRSGLFAVRQLLTSHLAGHLALDCANGIAVTIVELPCELPERRPAQRRQDRFCALVGDSAHTHDDRRRSGDDGVSYGGSVRSWR